MPIALSNCEFTRVTCCNISRFVAPPMFRRPHTSLLNECSLINFCSWQSPPVALRRRGTSCQSMSYEFGRPRKMRCQRHGQARCFAFVSSVIDRVAASSYNLRANLEWWCQNTWEMYERQSHLSRPYARNLLLISLLHFTKLYT